MLKTIWIVFLSCLAAGCGYFDVKPRDSEQGTVIARAFFSNSACSASGGVSESALGVKALTFGVDKVSQWVVGYLTDAVAQAAKADRETVTIIGQNPDYLFGVQGETVRMRGCLYVVVAPRVKKGEFCPQTAGKSQGNWYNPVNCKSGVAIEMVDKWKEWSLGTPTFFAQISFKVPKGGPASTVIPQVYKIYYPKPVTTMNEDKVKGFSILVSASKPGMSTQSTGDKVMEVFIGGDGVTPKTVSTDNSLQTSGLWVNLPAQEGEKGESYAGPVNLTVTVAETPHPTVWLQTIADFVATQKQPATDWLRAQVDPVAKAAAANAEEVAAATLRKSAHESCSAFSTQVEKLSESAEELSRNAYANYEERQRALSAFAIGCDDANLAGSAATQAWEKAGLKGAVCLRDQAPKHQIKALCASR